jgi:hypothetical protein
MIAFVKGRNDSKRFNILHMKFEACNSLMLIFFYMLYCLNLIDVCWKDVVLCLCVNVLYRRAGLDRLNTGIMTNSILLNCNKGDVFNYSRQRLYGINMTVFANQMAGYHPIHNI